MTVLIRINMIDNSARGCEFVRCSDCEVKTEHYFRETEKKVELMPLGSGENVFVLRKPTILECSNGNALATVHRM